MTEANWADAATLAGVREVVRASDQSYGGTGSSLAAGPQVLLRWRVGRYWTKKWHLVEPGLAVGEAHSRMLCGMLRQPSFNATEIAISTFPFELASAFTGYFADLDEAVRSGQLKNPDVCAGCRYELQKQLVVEVVA